MRTGHHMLAQLRTEAYPAYRGHVYPPRLDDGVPPGALSYERNVALIQGSKRKM